MSVRKRAWRNAQGEPQEAWVVDYVDQRGKRHIKTFDRKKDADAYHATVRVEVRAGTHTPESGSLTIAEAGDLWIKTAEGNDLERSTLVAYRSLVALHIGPRIGRVKLSALSAPMVRDFEDRLRQDGTSPAMVRKIRGALSMILADAMERGLVNRNVARELRRGKEKKAERRQKGRLKVGTDIPTPDEIRAIIGAAKGRWRPFLLTAIFCGLRSSELRGLRWIDVDLVKGELHVRQRADLYNEIGRPKSEAGERTIPVPAPVLNALKEWRLACPKGELGLVFPSGAGRIERYANIVSRGLRPTLIAAGVCTVVQDADGKQSKQAKYQGLHALRHFFASWCINRKADGGLELPLKIVSGRLGHSTISMTADVYGHLFPTIDDSAELATAAGRLFVV